jgi:hypothetical protein
MWLLLFFFVGGKKQGRVRMLGRKHRTEEQAQGG